MLKKLLKNRTVANAGWIIAGKIVHMLLAFFVGLLTARYLGPSNYGLINYASAYTTFFAALCSLGINSIIIKNFVDHPDEVGETIGTTLVLRAVSSFISVIIIIGIVSFADKSEPITIIVVALYSISVIFQVFDTLNSWFQSRLQSKYSAIATTISYVLVSAYKVWLLICGKSVEWFAVSNSIDYIAVAVFLLITYHRFNGPRFSFSWRKGKQLLTASSGFIISGLMVSIYASTDQLMLKQMMNEEFVGYYSTAVSISTMWNFILSAIIDSVYPTLMQDFQRDEKVFNYRNRQLYAFIFYLSVIVSIIICVFAKPIVWILYGKAYLPTVKPLRFICWYVAFSYLGVARNAWIVCYNRQNLLKYIYIGSALLNVILNCLLIPTWGMSGAALASLITQMSSILVFPAIIKPLRANTKLMIEAILLKHVFSSVNIENQQN